MYWLQLVIFLRYFWNFRVFRIFSFCWSVCCFDGGYGEEKDCWFVYFVLFLCYGIVVDVFLFRNYFGDLIFVEYVVDLSEELCFIN